METQHASVHIMGACMASTRLVNACESRRVLNTNRGNTIRVLDVETASARNPVETTCMASTWLDEGQHQSICSIKTASLVRF